MAKTKENKTQKFTRLANMRVNRALRAIRGIGQLGGGAYESTSEQRKTIKAALTQALDGAVSQLETGKSNSNEFKL